MGELDEHADKLLWEWADRQDQYLVDQFGLAIFGIGALFFAYAQVLGSALKLLIATSLRLPVEVSDIFANNCYLIVS
jgi:hypothetical protein